jgi:REP element-mobilizing transposase RayT
VKEYDYSSPGGYFVTLVTRGRECIFGEIQNGVMRKNRQGEIAREKWLRSVEIRKEIRLFEDEFVVMPNHVHGIVWIIGDRVGATGRSPLPNNPPRGPSPKSLASFIAGHKASVTKRINVLRIVAGMTVWQRDYYEHILRDEEDHRRIYEYILYNPLCWADDEENPNV